MSEERPGRFVKLPYGTFMDHLVAAPAAAQDGSSNAGYSRAFDAIPAKRNLTESTLCQKITNCLNKAKICPEHRLVLVSDTRNKHDTRRRDVEAALMLQRDAQRSPVASGLRTIMPVIFLRGEYDGESQDPMESDPFDEYQMLEETLPTYDNVWRCATRNRLMDIVEDLFSCQHRTHVFSLVVFGTWARIFYWDRCGAAYTEKFDYRQNPELLGNFLHGLTHMSPAGQGFDSSVMVLEPTSEGSKLMRKVAKSRRRSGDHIRKLFKKSLDEHYAWCKVRVDEQPAPPPQRASTSASQSTGDNAASSSQDTSASANVASSSYTATTSYTHGPTPDDSSEEEFEVSSMIISSTPVASRSRYFLVAKPIYEVREAHGRGIRAYIAFDPTTEDFVFLKDTWLSLGSVMPSMVSVCEGEVLRLLNGAGVENVPTLVCHGYVQGEGQTTKSEFMCDVEGSELIMESGPLEAASHYRLVIQEVGIPLSKAESGYEAVSVTRDCLIAHEQAFERLGVLHRDVSQANIIMVERGPEDPPTIRPARRGILIDWEMAYYVDKAPTPDANLRNYHTIRLGTPTFFSAFLASTPFKVHTLQDDLEAFLQLLFFCSLRILPNTCEGFDYFFHCYFSKLYTHALHRNPKYITMKNGRLCDWPDTDETIIFGSHPDTYPLNELFRRWLSWFQAYYQATLYDHPLVVHAPEYERPPTPEWLSGTQLDFGDPFGSPLYSPTSVKAVYSDAGDDTDSVASAPAPLAPGVRELAQKLDSHKATRTLFEEILTSHNWPIEKDGPVDGNREDEPLIATERIQRAPHDVGHHPVAGGSDVTSNVDEKGKKPADAGEEDTVSGKGKKAAAATDDQEAPAQGTKTTAAKGKKAAPADKNKAGTSKAAIEKTPPPPAAATTPAAPVQPSRPSRKRTAAQSVAEEPDDAPIAKRLRALPHRVARAQVDSVGVAGPSQPAAGSAKDSAPCRTARNNTNKGARKRV